MTIELVTTDGIFALDGGEWAVTNNIWLVGDDREVVVFDAAHDYETIVGFGANLLNDDIELVTACHDACNRYGMDALSSSAQRTLSDREARIRTRRARVSTLERGERGDAHRAL